MKIYTRTGDAGTTGLFGGDRVSKTHPRIATYGTVDEANSVIGLARAHLQDDRFSIVEHQLGRIQDEMFVVGADLATPLEAKPFVPRIAASYVTALERDIDTLEADLAPLKQFILPTGTPGAATLHLARTVCRRAERHAVETQATDPLNPMVLQYLNRLSDLLFVMARWVNQQAGVGDTEWDAPKPSE